MGTMLSVQTPSCFCPPSWIPQVTIIKADQGSHSHSYQDNQLLTSLKVASAILGRNINYYINLIFPHDPTRVVRKNQSPTRGGVVGFCAVFMIVLTGWKTPQHPPLVCDWLDQCLLWFGVVDSTVCYCVWSQSTGCVQRHVFLTAGFIDLWYFSLESLIQPLTLPNSRIVTINN